MNHPRALQSATANTVFSESAAPTLFAAYAAYLHQLGHPYGNDVIVGALARHPAVAEALFACFAQRFDPLRARSSGDADGAAERLDTALREVADEQEQRVFGLLRGLIAATLRTNFYRRDETGANLSAPALALKFDGRAVEGSPAPTPLYEIFVYSDRLEGIHLRGGKVARGGIRWSDRLADYRTEVHGLFKAQMVKNVVIVPEGAKGGFVPRRLPVDAVARRAEGIACYRIFIGCLLDLTDNRRGDTVLPPENVIRHDGDDPYLVVAADKGTATFSDRANEIAVARGFWLGDAFASGGSAGYDHKALGITARGAWEAVRRHFRELGVDADSAPLSVVGVGDMSGDVFGNGLLLTPQLRLLGAFDHRHIFVDPRPGVRAPAERRRLFALSSSSWDDFDRTALGPGGAIYRRDAARLALSPEAQQRFGLPGEVTPNELIRALLCAEADLLWLGGIGTYVRASDESDGEVGDRANDALRVSGRELRCKVVGEGANLGITQRGRIEVARLGGHLNTDAIDNAGGVACSDREVNIKVLCAGLEASGALTRSERDGLLAAMSDEVCAQVLSDVARQTAALSIACARAPLDLGRHVRLLRFFERNGQLDRAHGRALAGLPDEETIQRRRQAGEGLSRPELAVLLAHTKVALFAEFINADLPDDPLLSDDLFAYFPSALRTRYPDAIAQHPLRREIVTTALVNSMVDRVGSGFVNDLQERTGLSDAEIARAYLAARRLFAMEDLWAAIAGLDTAQDSARHRRLMLESRDIVENVTLWLLRDAPRGGGRETLAATVGRLAAPLAELLAWLAAKGAASGDTVEARLRLLRAASLRLDVLTLATRRGCAVAAAAGQLGACEETLNLPALADAIRHSCHAGGRGEADNLAAGELSHAAGAAALRIAERCLANGARLADYLAPRRPLLARYHAWRGEVAAGGGLGPAVLAVEALRGLAA